MGAVTWDHFTPWQQEILLAFHELQRSVGNEKGLDPAQAALQALTGGTSSVLDLVGGISPKGYHERTPGESLMAFAAPEAWLIDAYGTTRPTRKMVMEMAMKQRTQVAPGTAIYFAVWAGDEAQGDPTWWYFYGTSND
jgi:hypothetical protein